MRMSRWRASHRRLPRTLPSPTQDERVGEGNVGGRAIADSRERYPRLPVRPGSVAEPVQQHGRNPKVLARFQEIPPLEFALRTRDDLLDLREEAESVSLQKRGAGPRLVQGPRVRLPGIRGPSERPQDPFDMVDAPSVLALADRATRVAHRGIGLVRLESFPLQSSV